MRIKNILRLLKLKANMNIWNYKVFFGKQQIEASLPNYALKRDNYKTFINFKRDNNDLNVFRKKIKYQKIQHKTPKSIKSKKKTKHQKSYSLNPNSNSSLVYSRDLLFSFPEISKSTGYQTKVTYIYSQIFIVIKNKTASRKKSQRSEPINARKASR